MTPIYILSLTVSGTTQRFEDPTAAGRAYALADAAEAPQVAFSRGRACRTVAHRVRIGDSFAKSAPAPDRVERDHAFWAAYHETALPRAA